MRARGVLLVALIAPALAACVDLFHATDFETECSLDAAACAQADAAPARSDDGGARDGSQTGPDR